MAIINTGAVERTIIGKHDANFVHPLGDELITNGGLDSDSDWFVYGNSEISNGKANLNSGTGPYGGTLKQDSVVTNLKNYKISFTISNYQEGVAVISIGFNTSITVNANGDYTFYGISQSGDNTNFLVRNGASNFVGSIDNVSVKQVDPNDYWALFSGWSLGNNKVTYDGSGYSGIDQSISNLINKKIKVQFDIVDYTSGTIRILPNDRQDGADVRFSGNGTYTQIYTSTADKIVFQPQLLVGSITNISVVEILGDKPRIDYTDSLTSPSFLLEPQSTNLLTFSENLKNYENSNTFCTSNYAISPDGTKNATRVDFTASSTNALGVNGAVNNGETITQSVFVKYIDAQFVQLWFGSAGFSGGNTNFDLINGITSNPSGSSSTMENIGNGWWRISSTRTATSTSSSTGIFKLVVVNSLASSRFGDEANGSVLAFGGQYEQLSYPTSYIPTSGSTVTRAEETCIGAGSASTFNSTEGVLYAEIAALANDQTNRRITISDSTNANRVVMGYNTTSNEIFYFVVVNNSTVASGSYASSDITQFSKIAIKFAANNFALWVDGIERHTDISGAIFSQDTLTSLQFEQGAGNSLFFYGKTKGVYVFNEALTDDELQQLTGPEYNSFAALAAAYNYTVI